MTDTRTNSRRALLAATALTLALPAAFLAPDAARAADAAAAPAGADSGTAIQEVIVTARKREESVLRVPIAMTAITGQLKNADIRTLSDIVAFTPNVRIDPTYQRAGAANITIRGVSPTRTDDNSIDSPIGIFIDGVYLGSLPGQVIENFDVDRIEVLRGPQGTLFGRNTVGGAVSVFRTEPTGEWGVKAQVTTGSFNDLEFRVVANAPVIPDVLAFKGFAISVQNDGYLNNTYLNVHQPARDYINYGGELKFTPNDRFKALLTVEQYIDRSEGGAFLGNYNFCPGVLPKPTNPNDVDASGGLLGEFLPGLIGTGTNVPCRSSTAFPTSISTNTTDPGKVITNAYTLNTRYKINDNLQLVSVTGYRDQHEKVFFDFDGTSSNFINIGTDAHYHQFSEELRAEGSWNTSIGKISLVSGAYYYDSYFSRAWTTSGDFWNFIQSLSGMNLATDTWINPALAAYTGFADPVSACLAPRTTTPLQTVFGAVQCDPGASGPYGPGPVQKLYETQGTRSGALFLHGDWEFAPRLTATAGIRYTYERKHFDGYQAYIAPVARENVFAFPGSPTDLRNSWQRVTPTAAISFQMTPDVMWYASFAEGWHSGGFFGVNQDAADFKLNQYKPETSEDYEVGMKGQFFDHTVQVSLDGFLTEFHDKQESAIALDPLTNTVVTVFTNVGGVRYLGVEAEAQWNVTRQLHLAGTFGFLDAKYTSLLIGYPNAVNNNVPVIQDASNLLTPRNAPKFTLGGEATYNIDIGTGVLSLQSRVDWVDKEFTSLYNETYGVIPAHEDVSLSASYAWKDYKLTAFGRNITGRQFEIPTYIAPLFAASTISPPTSWGLELLVKF